MPKFNVTTLAEGGAALLSNAVSDSAGGRGLWQNPRQTDSASVIITHIVLTMPNLNLMSTTEGGAALSGNAQHAGRRGTVGSQPGMFKIAFGL